MNKKRIMSIVIAAVLIVGGVAGVSAAVRKTTSGNSSVMVVHAEELNWGYGMWDSESMEGYVTSDRVQNVNLSSSQTVSEIKVEEGDTVKKGDVLLTYDMTRTELNLEKEELNYERLQMNLENAEKLLQKLKRTSPVSDSGDDDFDDDFDDEDEDEELDDEELIPKFYKKLTADVEPFYDQFNEAEPGSEENPYRFFCEPGAEITSDFINAVKKLKTESGDCYFVIEVRENNQFEGRLIRAWVQNINELQVDRDWVGIVEPDSEKPIIPTKTYLDVEELEKKAEELEKKKEELEKKTEELEKDLKEAEEALKKASEQDAQSEQSSEKISELNQQIEELKKQNEALQGELDQYKSSTENTDAATDQLQSKNEALQAQVGELSSKIKELEQTIEELKAAASDSSGDDAQAEGTAFHSARPHAEIGQGVYVRPRAELAVVRRSSWKAVLTDAEDDDEDLYDDENEETESDGSDSDLINPDELNDDLEYTSDELKEAIKTEEETIAELKLDIREAEIKINSAKKALEDGSVKAAMNGVVTIVGDPETAAIDGTPLIRVSGSSGVAVKGGIKETLLDKIHVGDQITVESWSNGGRYTATITEISPYPDTSGMFESGGYNVSYYPFTAIVDDEDADMEDHDWVQISVDANTLADDEDAFYLMRAFVLEEGNTAYVYVRGEDGLLKKQSIRIGKLSGDSYEIRSGVSGNDWIAFPYGKNVKEGAKTYEGTVEELYNM